MSSPNDSEKKPDVPAGTTARRRILSRKLAEAASIRNAYWYRVGSMMIESELSGAEARRMIERDGNVVHWHPPYFRSMMRTTKTLMKSEIPDSLAMKCPFRFVKDALRHYRTGEITEEEAKLLITRRSRHVGTPQGLHLSSIRKKTGVRKVLDSIDHTTQNAQ